ncbi:MAG: endonuclease domain-containing protein [Kofleriaceae bacterium]
MSDPVLRRLARDQWVRIHGTPRVTVLVGGAHARALWDRWLALAELSGALLDGELEPSLREAVQRATAQPTTPIAVLARASELAAWRANRGDRLAAMVDEGLTPIDEPGAPAAPVAERALLALDARSAAEALLFEALEATRATAGRFRLNESLSVRFGPRAAEVDLLSRADRIAIEIDGIHHFGDPERYRRDRRKDLLMQTHGLLVVRVLAEDVLRDARGAVALVCQALAHRRAEHG